MFIFSLQHTDEPELIKVDILEKNFSFVQPH